MKDICVIIILYKPDCDNLERLGRLCIEADKFDIVAVDNTPFKNIDYALPKQIRYIKLEENKGIAYAQNEGIKQALKDNYDFILFSDQDSNWDVNYPVIMKDALLGIQKITPNVAALGPTIIDKATNQKYKQKNTTEDYIAVDTIISSGTIIPTNILRIVGMMDSSLFIDFVDHEWCWRAKSKGYNIFRANIISLYHKVGIRNLRVLGFCFVEAAPFRYYYIYRNYLWLCKRRYVPLKWKIRSGIKNLATIVLLPLICKGRWKDALSYLLKGLWVGLTKKSNGV